MSQPMCGEFFPPWGDLRANLAILVAWMVKNLPANAGDMGTIPGMGKSPEGGMVTHSSILAWKIILENFISSLENITPSVLNFSSVQSLSHVRLFATP